MTTIKSKNNIININDLIVPLANVGFGVNGCIYHHEYVSGESSFGVYCVPEWLSLNNYLDGDEYYIRQDFESFYDYDIPDDFANVLINYDKNPVRMVIKTLWEYDGMLEEELSIRIETSDTKIAGQILDSFERFKEWVNEH